MTSKIISKSSLNLDLQCLPNHVAIIMDGNGRWANQKGLPRIAGHRQGANTLKAILRLCKDLGIETLTVYAFSTENWGRPIAEVDFLMLLFEGLLRKELTEMNSEGVRINFIGNLEPLPKSLQQEIEQSIATTKDNRAINFNIAINYGGRQEIIQACRQIAKKIEQGEIKSEAIDENLFEQCLYTSGMSSPDLLIRTSGEMRISNFLLWQIAYAEIYVTDTLWPDFNLTEFECALKTYQKRDRRFGKL